MLFDHFKAIGGHFCPLCKTQDRKPVCLVIVDGTNDGGGMTYEAMQVHVDCIELRYNPDMKLIYQKVRGDVAWKSEGGTVPARADQPTSSHS